MYKINNQKNNSIIILIILLNIFIFLIHYILNKFNLQNKSKENENLKILNTIFNKEIKTAEDCFKAHSQLTHEVKKWTKINGISFYKALRNYDVLEFKDSNSESIISISPFRVRLQTKKGFMLYSSFEKKYIEKNYKLIFETGIDAPVVNISNNQFENKLKEIMPIIRKIIAREMNN